MKNLLLLLAAVICSSIANAQDLSGKIVFSHFNKTTQTDSIYSLDNNGQNLTYITNGYRPRLSHNGKLLAFSNGSIPNSSFSANLWIRDLAMQKDTQIVGNAFDYLDYYDFSPSDQKLIYSQSCSIYTTNIDGSESYTYVGCVPCDCYSDDPTVRLSDSVIVYHNVHSGLYTSGFDGSNPQVVPHTYAGDLYPIWSPDGQWITFLKSIAGSPYYTNNLFKIKADGSDSTQLTFFSTTDTITADPVWAKDMQSVYIIARVSDTIGLYRVNTDGSGSYTIIRSWSNSGSTFDYWMGLADSISSSPVSNNTIATPVADFTIIPNPSSSQSYMNVNLIQPSTVLVELFDLAGKKINSVFQGTLSGGEHTLQINVASLSAGSYIVKLSANGFHLQEHLVIVR